MNFVKLFDKAIEYLFYLLFFLVPIVLSPSTFELFEFNKMWLTFGITALIGFFWIGKMILQRRILFCRTPLDIPILLFLLSQILSTVFSLDSHVSLWGYYSRFNGSLLSYICYIFLYYAFVSNFTPQTIEKNKANLRNFFDQIIVRRMLLISIASGVFVALWGLPSHFGYDPTCKLFKGSLDVACWTSDFQPKVRIFSTMGQPAWLAAYLAILLPITIAFAISFFQKARSLTSRDGIMAFIFSAISILFFVDLLFTRTRAGTIGTIVSFAIFFGFLVYQEFKKRTSVKKILTSKASLFIAIFLLLSFFIGTSIGFIDKFSFNSIKDRLASKSSQAQPTQTPSPFRGELGGTDSSKIRLIVWRGALDVWKNNPIFGTGVETFAYAYYKYRPPEHNLTSEWNFLYNKAHNEFLNFMATTGTFGIASYLSILIVFSIIVTSYYSPNVKRRTSWILSKIQASDAPYFDENKLLGAALFASFASIIITNFFGFSVVITNIYLFMIPAFLFILWGVLERSEGGSFADKRGQTRLNDAQHVSTASWIGLGALAIPTFLTIMFLINSWRADTWYALGYNLDRAGDYQKAYPLLHKAVQGRLGEPVFKDEMAVNDAVLAVNLMTQTTDKTNEQDQAAAQNLVQEAISTTNQLTADYPSNIVFLKTKVRIYYTLSQIDPSYLPMALEAIKQTARLAPTEASIHYNLGVLTGQAGDSKGAVKILEETIKLKPDYRDAYFALGLFYHDLAVDESGNIVDANFAEKAEEQMRFILEKLEPSDTRAKEQLSAWEGTKP